MNFLFKITGAPERGSVTRSNSRNDHDTRSSHELLRVADPRSVQWRSSRALLQFLLFLSFASAIFVSPLAAQTNTPPTLSSNRFLFVLDTSAAMKKKLPEMLTAVDQILASSASGTLHEGDTLGLWTFNQDVYAKFPLQTWGRIGSGDIAMLIHSFMQHQRFTNSVHLDKALQEMFGVMGASDVITVVLIYGGEEPIKGTPFDLPINRYLKANVKASKGKGVPAVVVLESKGGAAFDYAVSASPWPVEIPPLLQPPPPEPKPTPPTPVAETVKPPAPAAKLPPLILSGRQTPVITPPPVPAPPVPVVAVEKTTTSAVVVNSPPTQAPEPMSPALPQPEPVITPVPPSPPAPQPAAEPATKTAPAPSNETAATAPSATITATQEPSSVPPPAEATGSPAPSPAPLANAVLPVTTRPAGYLIAGLVLAIVAIGLIILMLKRARQRAGTSFISRSISEKK